jgi:flagellar biosynthesis protein FlhG
MNNVNTTLSLAVMSGKGGVGKTSIALNLGYALYKAGSPLMLMDCDLGLANLDVMLGLSPERNLHDLLEPEVKVRDILIPIEQGGLDFLPAASGVPELVEMDAEMQSLLLQKLGEVFGDYQYLLLDLGAGISPTVLSFAAMTHLRIVVITPEPTSLTDSYALMKVLYTQYGISDFFIVVNQVTSPAESRQAFERLKAACQRFLGFDIHLLGSVQQDPAVSEAVRRQMPLLKSQPKSKAAQDILALALKLQRMRQESLGLLADQAVLKKFPSPRTE